MNRINELIEEHNIDVEILAKAIGLNNPTMLYNWIDEKYFPSKNYLIKICDYFACSCDYLLKRTDDYTTVKTKKEVDFKTQLAKFLSIKNISKYKLAKEAKINKSNVYSWFTKNTAPTTDMVVKLADFLNVSVDELIGRII